MEQKISIAIDRSSMLGMGGNSGLVNISNLIGGISCWEQTAKMDHLAPINGWAKRHSLASRVLHKSQPVVQQFHDCGYLIQHVSLVGDVSLGTIQSSRVVVFGAGLVKIQGAAVGFAIFAAPSTPMLTCGKIPLPVAASDDSPSNGVVVGMDEEWDHQCGWDHIWLLMLSAFVGQVKETVELIVDVLTCGSTALAKLALNTGLDMAEGVVLGIGGRMLGDYLGSRDVGRRYQERMQRRRAAGEEDFESARDTEGVRGIGEGVAEVLAGPIGGLGVGPVSNWLFGTGPDLEAGPEEPEV